MHRLYDELLEARTFRFHPEQLAQLRELSTALGLSIADTVRETFEAGLREKRRQVERRRRDGDAA